jgi:hypothetical protein
LNIGVGNKFAAVLDAMLNLFAAGLADLASHLAVCPGDLDQGRRVGVLRRFGYWSHGIRAFLISGK